VRRLARVAIEVARLACSRERLEEAPAVSTPETSRRNARRLLRGLFAIEPLPTDPPGPAAPPRRGSLHSIFAPEPLPTDVPGPAAPPRRRWLHWIFAPEPLPRDPVPPRRRRPSRLAALFAPEKLDDSP
jgi:hypothetical protein